MLYEYHYSTLDQNGELITLTKPLTQQEFIEITGGIDPVSSYMIHNYVDD